MNVFKMYIKTLELSLSAHKTPRQEFSVSRSGFVYITKLSVIIENSYYLYMVH